MMTASTLGGLAVSFLGNTPPEEVSEDLASEQHSAFGSALKVIQPGSVNGFNKKMQKTAGMDYKAVDFLSKRNMTWTSQPPTGDGLKRIGIKTRNAAKTISTTAISGAGSLMAANLAMPMFKLASDVIFEGGVQEISTADRVVMIKRKF
jgi:hypothetical protein